MDVIRKRIDEEYNGKDLLNSLPSHNSMKWVPVPSEITTNSHLALVIGHAKGRDILAILMRFGDKPREVRYCSKSRYSPSDSYTMLQQDDIVRLPLFAPFKYNADISKAAKRKFSIVIKWYFMLKGLLTDGTGGDFTDYCKRFYDALRKIEAGQEEEAMSGRKRRTSAAAATVEESPDPDEPKSMYPLRSGRLHHGPEPQQDQLATPVETPLSADDGDDNPDYIKLCRYLDSHGELYLLKNMPEADCVQFVEQNFLPEAQHKKLFVGRHKSGDDIYAYMRPCRNQHEINFWIEGNMEPRRASTEDVAKQRIFHPFNKTFPKDGHNMDQADRARLTLIVKWYFIAAGLAKDFVLKETKAYPERLRSALDYIAHRMGPAAASPESSTPQSKDSRPGNFIPSTPIDESHIQSTLANVPTASPPTHDAPRSATRIIPVPTIDPSPRGIKRTAEDAEFEDLAKLLVEDQTLTKQVNLADEVLETLDLQRQAFMEKWNSQHNAALTKRQTLEARRGDVRKRFKRQSLAVAGKVDEEEEGKGEE